MVASHVHLGVFAEGIMLEMFVRCNVDDTQGEGGIQEGGESSETDETSKYCGLPGFL